jgi:hypothetical protein
VLSLKNLPMSHSGYFCLQWLCVASVVFPERFTAQTLLQDLENTDTSFEIYVKGVPTIEDLEWVGPHRKMAVKDIRGEDISTIAPEVDPTEASTTSDMDVDKEEQDVVRSEPSITIKEVATELSSWDIDEGNLVTTTSVISMKIITAVM